MCRSRRAATATVLALGLTGAAPALAQDEQPGPPADAAIRDMTFPILDIELPVSSLDGSVEQTAERITLSADILFAFDKASLTKRAASRLDTVRDQLRAAKPASVTIEGHTDDKGSDTYNRRLSERRARTVARALRDVLGGVQVKVVGRGEADPVASNTVDGADSPKGRARNRRVEIRLPKEGS